MKPAIYKKGKFWFVRAGENVFAGNDPREVWNSYQISKKFFAGHFRFF